SRGCARLVGLAAFSSQPHIIGVRVRETASEMPIYHSRPARPPAGGQSRGCARLVGLAAFSSQPHIIGVRVRETASEMP
ncbi:hypothetical protein CPL67_28290, partial [Klebsiella pneumoniae]